VSPRVSRLVMPGRLDYTRCVDVTFEVGGETYVVAEPQATILAENLRILSKSEFATTSEPAALLGADDNWRAGAKSVAESIEATLVDRSTAPLHLEGGAADATYCVLRLMVGLDKNGASGLRDALGAPVVREDPPAAALSVGITEPLRHLSRPELLELLVILFVLAVLSVVLGFAWTGTWWVLAPVIAGLLGLRVATTRTSGRLAWTLVSVVWWGIFLVPAAVLVTLVGLLVVAILNS
jgi:hypothetical protein